MLRNGVYHAGFNSGFNVAEAVNFATPQWLQYGLGLRALRCKCRPDQVSINVANFIRNLIKAQPRHPKRVPFSISEL